MAPRRQHHHLVGLHRQVKGHRLWAHRRCSLQCGFMENLSLAGTIGASTAIGRRRKVSRLSARQRCEGILEADQASSAFRNAVSLFGPWVHPGGALGQRLLLLLTQFRPGGLKCDGGGGATVVQKRRLASPSQPFPLEARAPVGQALVAAVCGAERRAIKLAKVQPGSLGGEPGPVAGCAGPSVAFADTALGRAFKAARGAGVGPAAGVALREAGGGSRLVVHCEFGFRRD